MKKAFKLFSLFLALGCSVLGAKAQTFGDFKYRAEAGVTASQILNFGTGKPLWGMRAAGFVVLPFSQIPLSLNTGLVLTNKGERQTFTLEKGRTSIETKTGLMYLQLPIEADYCININEKNRIHIAAGPYLGLGLAGESQNLVRQGNNVKLFSEEGGETPFNRFEFGFGGSVAYQYTHFYLKAGADLGLTNAANNSRSFRNSGIVLSNGTKRNAVAYLTFGYEF